MEMNYRMLSVLEKHTDFSTLLHYIARLLPVWAAVLLGLVVGWAWRPKWVSLLVLGIRSRSRLLWTSPPGLGGRRIWLAITAFTAFQILRDFWFNFKAWKWPFYQSEERSASQPRETRPQLVQSIPKCQVECNEHLRQDFVNAVQYVIGDRDLRDLQQRFLCNEGGLPWELMMNKATPGMSYQAWRRDPQGGPTEYKSRTVFEDASPDIVKDFYWDDEFRAVWDDMLIYSKSVEACVQTGQEVAHWIRKFPFFCSDREYLIGRRIFKCGDTFFCITKGVPYSAIPRRSKPHRVDVYYSSWCVRAGVSCKSGQKTACEVIFFHSEDMGIPKEIAKFGVRQGMWGCVKKMEPGLRKYQAVRKTSEPLSPSASIAQMVTEVPLQEASMDASSVSPQYEAEERHRSPWKWVAVGAAVVLACTMDKGIVGKVLIIGVARQLAKLAKRL